MSQLLMLSPKLPKTEIPYVCLGGGGVPTFDAESKTALNPKLPKTRIPCVRGGGGGWGEVPDCGRHLVRMEGG